MNDATRELLDAVCPICRKWIAEPSATPGLSLTRGSITKRSDGTWVHTDCESPAGVWERDDG